MSMTPDERKQFTVLLQSAWTDIDTEMQKSGSSLAELIFGITYQELPEWTEFNAITTAAGRKLVEYICDEISSCPPDGSRNREEIKKWHLSVGISAGLLLGVGMGLKAGRAMGDVDHLERLAKL